MHELLSYPFYPPQINIEIQLHSSIEHPSKNLNFILAEAESVNSNAASENNNALLSIPQRKSAPQDERSPNILID